MSKRSNWKVPYILKLFLKPETLKKKVIYVRKRNSIIPSNYINKRLRIHNGSWYSTVFVNPKMLGFKLGEFSFSRRVGTQKHLKEKRRKKGSKHKK